MSFPTPWRAPANVTLFLTTATNGDSGRLPADSQAEGNVTRGCATGLSHKPKPFHNLQSGARLAAQA